MFPIYRFSEYIRTFAYAIPAILIAITVHEFAHAYVSYKLGDPNPKYEGRLTLNPFVHIDLIGFLCMFLFRIGWAKPVRINPYYYKNRKRDIVLVLLAGSVMNYFTAFISMFVYGILYQMDNQLHVWFYYISLINVGYGTFNLLPFPPLDGEKILIELCPKVEDVYARLRPYSIFILILLLMMGFTTLIHRIENAVLDVMWNVVKTILHILLPKRNGIFI